MTAREYANLYILDAVVIAGGAIMAIAAFAR
jgi:hypothetical protein